MTYPNNQYSAINMRARSLGASRYDALNVKLQTQDLQQYGANSLVTNYTFGHACAG